MGDSRKTHFLVGTRWFGVLGPCFQLIEKLNSEGYKVFVFGQKDKHYHRYYRDNCELVEIHMKRSYVSFFFDILDMAKLVYYILRYRPRGIHSFNPKPSLIAGQSCLLFPKVHLFIGVTGLGNTFIRAPKLSRYIVLFLRLVCKRSSFVFFQNPDDVDLFRQKNIVDEQKIKLFIGPGVDLDVFRPRADTAERTGDDSIAVLTMGRLIWQKGIREYIEAARMTANSDRTQRMEFLILGEYDFDHPDCVDPAFVEAAVEEGIIRHIPWTDDVVSILQNTDIFVLHSYREGAPRAILEASACCLPTVGADAIGVRELVIDNVTGFLTPLRDAKRLQEAIIRLADDRELRQTFGRAALEKIAEPYSLTNSTKAQLEMYNSCGYFDSDN